MKKGLLWLVAVLVGGLGLLFVVYKVVVSKPAVSPTATAAQNLPQQPQSVPLPSNATSAASTLTGIGNLATGLGNLAGNIGLDNLFGGDE